MEFLKILPAPLLLVVTIIANVAANVTRKQYGILGCGGRDNAYIYSAVTSAVCTVLMVLFSGFQISLSWYTLGMGLLFGVCTMLSTVFLAMAMRIGPMSYTLVINSASTVITALSGFLFWQEELGALKIAGLVLMLGCLVFSVKKDSGGRRASLVWFLLTLFSAVAGAGIGLLQKIHQSSEHREELMGFLIIAFAFAFVTSAIPYLWHRRGVLFSHKTSRLQPAAETAARVQTPGETEKVSVPVRAEEESAASNGAAKESAAPGGAAVAGEQTETARSGDGAGPLQSAGRSAAEAAPAKKRFRWGRGAQIALLVVSGVTVALNNIINLYLAGVMESAVFFPLVNGVGLAVGIVAGLVIFREKLSPLQWAGIACGVAATLLLCL